MFNFFRNYKRYFLSFLLKPCKGLVCDTLYLHASVARIHYTNEPDLLLARSVSTKYTKKTIHYDGIDEAHYVESYGLINAMKYPPCTCFNKPNSSDRWQSNYIAVIYLGGDTVDTTRIEIEYESFAQQFQDQSYAEGHGPS